MHRIIFIITSSLLISCGNESVNQEPIENAERPTDWHSSITLQIAPDTTLDEHEFHLISQFSSSESFDILVDQLFQLAFSGDAKVYVPDIFGEPDEGNPIDPKELAEYLKHFESIAVEDILTGEMKDTTIDLSFSKNSASALSLWLNVSISENQPNFNVSMIGLGKQVFNDENGEFRGIQNKFYIGLEDQANASNSVKQRFVILSDSNGAFFPAWFENYSDTKQNEFEELLNSLNVGNGNFLWQGKANFNYRQRWLKFAQLREKES